MNPPIGWGPKNLKPYDGKFEFLDDDPYTGRTRITLHLNTTVTRLDIENGNITVGIDSQSEAIKDKLILLTLPQEVLQSLIATRSTN
jgi:NADPH-dependent 2,4-dienoyl-CoA reductase/sulfur reductase-like enzyme